VQHAFERNIELFSNRVTAVRSFVDEVKEILEGGQRCDRMESFE
jgi:hypothetical protein